MSGTLSGTLTERDKGRASPAENEVQMAVEASTSTTPPRSVSVCSTVQRRDRAQAVPGHPYRWGTPDADQHSGVAA